MAFCGYYIIGGAPIGGAPYGGKTAGGPFCAGTPEKGVLLSYFCGYNYGAIPVGGPLLN